VLKTRYSPEQRRELAENARIKKRLMERKKKLFKRIYKKSWLYISTLTARLFYITFLTVALLLGDTFSTQKKEIVTKTDIEYQTHHGQRGGSYTVSTLRFSTDQDEYVVYNGFLIIEKGDTITVERNLFHKPIYYSKDNWNKKFGLNISRMYYIIFFITALSFLLTEVLNEKIRKFIIIISIIDLLALVAYFFY
jgi:hypothetical protein